ncbi:MAG: S-adenosylmethionine decarboxylase [Azonexus sp.]|jgi:spermidine synthase/S-adenosylmethionine decarboxylase|nr:S-adenosylmethionine decarboxylase [Betaproteobacteria bacterium]MBK8919670.1 S-adenosylmethionine decarboxylase [Betaproteobacteria bacterium]MBP6034912.1 S-adenosylmethionine decarboxylase [Azonexus sp.]MBP6905618.1 S-adenosylmethionine decarboxylase [Azonexus sp.]
MQGLHLTADLLDCRCPPALLLDAAGLECFAVEACGRHGLSVVGAHFHQFRDGDGRAAGVTGTVVLAESHFALHTWPEIAGVTLDVYVCNFSADNSQRARGLFAEAIATFAPDRLETREVQRGVGVWSERERKEARDGAPCPPSLPHTRNAGEAG